MRTLVCGGRNYRDWERVCYVLEANRAPGRNTLICGMAKGADSLAWRWFDAWGYDIEEYPADWDKYGKRAGYIRNQQMLDEGKPDQVIAFPGGKGTKMMIDLARKANVKVLVIDVQAHSW